jgi:acetamidase/formamidase
LNEDFSHYFNWEALQVLSQVVSAQVANVVDPNFTVVAKFPKKYLRRDRKAGTR